MNTIFENQEIKEFGENLENLFSFSNKEEKNDFEIVALHLDLMNDVKKLMEIQNINYKTLAEKLNVNKSHVSQLFRGDRIFNAKLLIKLQNIFNVKFEISQTSRENGIMPQKPMKIIKGRNYNHLQLVA